MDVDTEGGGDEEVDNEGGSGDDEMELGEDEVVREIDVYLHPSMDNNTKLYVMQYPLRPKWRPYELEERCEEVRVKPSSSAIEVDLSNKSSEVEVEESILLKGEPTPLLTGGYAVGVLVGHKLHLNPIHAVVQLRPSMEHHKPGGPKKTNIQTSTAENPVKIEEVKEQKPPVPSRKQSQAMGKLQDKDIEESWVCLKYHGAQSDISSRYLKKMVEEVSPVQPMSEETREALPKALVKLFKIHRVCSFQQICQHLREMAVSESARPKGNAREATAAAMGVNAPPEKLQAIINQVAVNIHGVYVLRSSPNFPEYDAFRKVVIALLLAGGPNAKLKRASVVGAVKLEFNIDIPYAQFRKVITDICVSEGTSWVLKRGDGSPKWHFQSTYLPLEHIFALNSKEVHRPQFQRSCLQGAVCLR